MKGEGLLSTRESELINTSIAYICLPGLKLHISLCNQNGEGNSRKIKSIEDHELQDRKVEGDDGRTEGTA